MGISIAGIVVYRASYFGMYDTAKATFLEDENIVRKWMAAQLITLAASFLSYPLNTVRARLMMQSGRPAEDVIYKGTLDCFKVILR